VDEGDTEPIPRVPRRPRRERPADLTPEPEELDELDEQDGWGEEEPPARRSRTTTGHGHGHGHSHTPATPASARVRRLLVVLLVPFAVAALAGTLILFPYGTSVDSRASAEPVDAVITSTERGGCSTDVEVGQPADDPGAAKCLLVTVRLSEGPASGREISTLVPLEPSTPRFAVDDEVVLNYSGGNPNSGVSYQLVDFQRKLPLALLAALFAVAVLILGRWQGLKALGALVISFLVLVFFVLPAILEGESPLLVGICGAGVIMFVVLYLTHGLSARTSTAVLGTMVSLAMIGGLGALWAALAKLTGLDEDTATVVGILGHSIDTRGLLLAGVLIGALGVLDDVTVTQTSAVWELRAANSSLTTRELYAAGLRIGRDHVASAVNTLVMAYAGAALPLLLYSSMSGVGIANIVSSQAIAQEIVRTLVGSIGLVAAVPITTALAAVVATQEPAAEAPRAANRAEPSSDDRPRRRPAGAAARRRPDDPDAEPGTRRPARPNRTATRRRPAVDPDSDDADPRRPQPRSGRRAAAGGRPNSRPDPGSGQWPEADLRDGSGPPPRVRPGRGSDAGRGNGGSGQWAEIDPRATSGPQPRMAADRPDPRRDTGPQPRPGPRPGPGSGQWAQVEPRRAPGPSGSGYRPQPDQLGPDSGYYDPRPAPPPHPMTDSGQWFEEQPAPGPDSGYWPEPDARPSPGPERRAGMNPRRRPGPADRGRRRPD
jgi:uncharacterized membrane protein